MLRGGGMVIAVLDVVLAHPGDLDRCADLLRKIGRLGAEIGLRFAAEGTAEQGDIRLYLCLRHADRLGGRLAQRLAVLAAGPDLHRVARHMRHRGRNLHRRMHEMRRPICGLDHLGIAAFSAASTSPRLRRMSPGVLAAVSPSAGDSSP